MKQLIDAINKHKYTMIAVLFWLLVWQVLSSIINKEILLASPKAVVSALCTLVRTKRFWWAVGGSFGKIVLGFLLAVFVGVLLALLSCTNRMVKEIISVLIKLIKSIPVASFVIVVLLWVKSKNLSILISFLMVLPVIYTNVLSGIESTDKKLLEMAKVFKMPMPRKIRAIYIPAVTPFFVSACSVGLGFCWKSGIAAELIGQPKNSIGANLYEAKLFMMTNEVFAWTIVIVLLSVIFEKTVMFLIKKAVRK